MRNFPDLLSLLHDETRPFWMRVKLNLETWPCWSRVTLASHSFSCLIWLRLTLLNSSPDINISIMSEVQTGVICPAKPPTILRLMPAVHSQRRDGKQFHTWCQRRFLGNKLLDQFVSLLVELVSGYRAIFWIHQPGGCGGEGGGLHEVGWIKQ